MALAGSVALVSGGARGLGRAIAARLTADGAHVAVGDLDEDPPPSTPDYHRVDVTDPAAVEAWVATVELEHGTPTLVVANAGIATTDRLLEMSPQTWRHELAVNLDGAFHVATAAARRMVATGVPGRIVFTGSWAGHVPHPTIPAYSVAKAGLRMLCKCLAAELAAHDILVNEVGIGIVDGGMSGRRLAADPVARERATAAVPVQRLMTEDDVAEAVAFLCAEANRHMTGSLLLVDGGLSLLQARPHET
jgi:glucose 1-dehydrogenase